MATVDPLFGIHPQALALQRSRMEMLAANIANADTPGYQARDLDFAQALKQADNPAVRLDSRRENHIGSGSAAATATRFRVVQQPSADGNTVDLQVEQAQFADAALHYQASLSFIDGRLKGLMTAITGQ